MYDEDAEETQVPKKAVTKKVNVLCHVRTHVSFNAKHCYYFRTQAWDGRFESVDFGDINDETVPFNFSALEMVAKVRLTCL